MLWCHYIGSVFILLELSCWGQITSAVATSSAEGFSHNNDIDQFTLINRRIRESGTKQDDSGSANANSTNAKPSIEPREGVMIIKAKPPDVNYTKKAPVPYEAYDNESDENTSGYPSGQPKFDEKAIQRALIVVAVLAFILLGYLGAKFMLTKKRKVDKRYGRIESELDLLEEMETAESDEEEELFDVNMTRRSNF